MLVKITLLTSLAFAAIYPLCFWIGFNDPLKNKFHKFHLGLANTVGGIVLVFLVIQPSLSINFKIAICVWKALLLGVSRFYWKKESPSALALSLPAILGIYLFLELQNAWIKWDILLTLSSLLGSFIFASALFAMNLGHWYLNVHGLNLKYLKSSLNVLTSLLIVRALWNLYFLFTSKIIYQGNNLSFINFTLTLDGMLLWLGILFGILFPLFSVYFAHETLKLKNTQSTTGILYVILCAIIIGDMTYKYYALKFGIFL